MISIFNQEAQSQKLWVNVKLQTHKLTDRPFGFLSAQTEGMRT